MDLGHSAQNVYLQSESLNLGTCAIGAFNDELVTKVLQLPDNEAPLYIMPVGKYK
jgi:nitroreductase